MYRLYEQDPTSWSTPRNRSVQNAYDAMPHSFSWPNTRIDQTWETSRTSHSPSSVDAPLFTPRSVDYSWLPRLCMPWLKMTSLTLAE